MHKEQKTVVFFQAIDNNVQNREESVLKTHDKIIHFR
ncbi:MAG: hypothetical protein HCAMLNBO_01218 [Candidatus Brocadia fulgida]|nr:hypothetical protein [Candidatus Brocadia fulgida]